MCAKLPSMTRQNIATLVLRLTQYLLLGFIIVLPLIWFRYTAELFEVPKMLAVYAFTVIISFLWLARMVVEKRLIFNKTPLGLFLGLFLFSQLVSTLFSIDINTSIFGYPSRAHGGILSTLSYTVIFFALVSHFNKNEIKKVALAISLSGLLAALYALPEHFGYSFSCLAVTGKLVASCWIQDVVLRIFGTFGQPNWLAAYMVGVIPITWGLLSLPSTKKVQKVLLFISQLLMFSTLVFTKSRSGLVALAVSFVLYWLLFVAKTKLRQLKTIGAVSLSLAVVMLIFGTEYSPSVQQIYQRNWQKNLPEQNLTGTVLDNGSLEIPVSRQGGTESGQIRAIVWKGAIDTFLARPLIGYGVETFAYSYYQHRPLEHNLVSEWDFLYNKAHNELLNIAANTGIVGLLTYLLLILSVLVLGFYSLFKKGKKQQTNSNWTLSLSVISSTIAVFTSNFFGFSTVSVGLLFAYSVALLVLPDNQNHNNPRPKAGNLKFADWLVIGAIGIISLWLLTGVGKILASDMAFAKAGEAESSNQLLEASKLYQQAIDLRPREARFHSALASNQAKMAYVYALEDQLPMAESAAQTAFKHSSLALASNPYDLNTYKEIAGVYIRLSSLDPKLLNTAKQIISKALNLAPTDAKLVYNLGLISLDQKELEEAKTWFAKAVEMKSDYEGARLELAKILETQGEKDQALEQYRYIIEFINPDNSAAREALEATGS